MSPILHMRRGTRHQPGASSSVLVCSGSLAGSRRELASGGGQGGPSSVLAGGVRQQALVDLAERDRERLLLRCGVDQGADVLQQALGELAVVGVDLAGALGGVDHQAVLAAGALEQLVDRRVGDALRGGCDSGHGRACSSTRCAGGRRRVLRTGASGAFPAGQGPSAGGAVSNRTNSSAARATSSLTTTTSNSPAASSSACARASRRD